MLPHLDDLPRKQERQWHGQPDHSARRPPMRKRFLPLHSRGLAVAKHPAAAAAGTTGKPSQHRLGRHNKTQIHRRQPHPQRFMPRATKKINVPVKDQPRPRRDPYQIPRQHTPNRQGVKHRQKAQ